MDELLATEDYGQAMQALATIVGCPLPVQELMDAAVKVGVLSCS
jgi:hypothetical protein